MAEPPRWEAARRDWTSTEWEALQFVSNSVTGTIDQQTQRYVEVSDGLNYLDSEGQWKASVDGIELMTNNGAAVALHGPTKAYFPAAVGGAEPLVLVTASNTVLKLKPIAVCYFDAASGRSVLLGQVGKAEAELLPPIRWYTIRQLLRG